MPEKLKYKNPPIVERVIGVFHKIPQDEFESRLPAWMERIKDAYPISGHIARWLIDIEVRDGVPFVKSLVPKARIIHVFWQKHPKNEHICGMRITPDGLVFHLGRERGDVHSFEELLPEMERWCPFWMEHFGIREIDGVKVEYYNRLDGTLTPQFIGPDGAIRLGEALTIFKDFPTAQGLTDPCDCKARLVIDQDKPTYFDVRVRGDGQGANAVRVDFMVRTFPGAQKLSCSEALSELNSGHDVMLEQFSCFFTEAARRSFSE